MRSPFELPFDRRPRALGPALALVGCVLALSGPATRAAAADETSPPASPAVPAAPASPSAPIHEQALDLLVLRPLGTARVAGGALLWLPLAGRGAPTAALPWASRWGWQAVAMALALGLRGGTLASGPARLRQWCTFPMEKRGDAWIILKEHITTDPEYST